MRTLLPFVLAALAAAQNAAAQNPADQNAADQPAAVQDPGDKPGAAVLQRAADANDFAGALQRQLPAGNAFWSPASVSAAFAICQAACDGATRADIDAVLHFAQLPEALHAAMAALQQRLQQQQKGCEVALANHLWGNRNAPKGYYQQPFLQAMQRRYGACFDLADFSQPDAARQLINRWVAGQTNQRIDELLPDGSIDASTVLVIANAIWFRGDWAVAFDPQKTRPGDFHLTAEHAVQVPLMRRHGELQLGSIDGAEVLALPYVGDRVRMLVLLPQDGLAALEGGLGSGLLAKARASLQKQTATVVLPRFELHSKCALHEQVLPALGMKAPFAPSRDWGPLNGGDDPLCISGVYHDAFVAVDEQGTEAAAATAIVTKRGGRPRQFVADRPFLFVIEDVATGLVLFSGRVVDPSAGQADGKKAG